MSTDLQAGSENEKIRPKRAPRKRQVHNEVERRRKGKINNWIHKLSELLPNEEGNKKSKISILEHAVSYIKEIVAERDKLLSDQCSEVQAEEINSLKKNIRYLQEQNAAYSKLLQQANISLGSLPKKPQKYSNKFTEEFGTALLQSYPTNAKASNQEIRIQKHPKITCTTSASTDVRSTAVSSCTATSIPSNSVVPKPITPLILPTSSSSSSSSPVTNSNVLSCLTSASIITESKSMQSTASVSQSSTGKTNVSLSSSGGGVTSALPSLPVMSNTVGSSLSNVYSKGMQIIILSAGTSFVQPSFVPSNIPIVSPCLDGVWPVIVPQNVPLQTLAIASENATNGIIVRPEANSCENRTVLVPDQNIVPVSCVQTTTNSDCIIPALVNGSSTNKVVECVSEGNELLPISGTERIDISTFSVSKTGDNTVTTIKTSVAPEECPVSKINGNSPVPSTTFVKPTSFEPVSFEEASNTVPDGVEPCKDSEKDESSTESAIISVPKQTHKKTPPSLQVLSANEVISLASKCKLALKSPLSLSKQLSTSNHESVSLQDRTVSKPVLNQNGVASSFVGSAISSGTSVNTNASCSALIETPSNVNLASLDPNELKTCSVSSESTNEIPNHQPLEKETSSPAQPPKIQAGLSLASDCTSASSVEPFLSGDSSSVQSKSDGVTLSVVSVTNEDSTNQCMSNLTPLHKNSPSGTSADPVASENLVKSASSPNDSLPTSSSLGNVQMNAGQLDALEKHSVESNEDTVSEVGLQISNKNQMMPSKAISSTYMHISSYNNVGNGIYVPSTLESATSQVQEGMCSAVVIASDTNQPKTTEQTAAVLSSAETSMTQAAEVTCRVEELQSNGNQNNARELHEASSPQHQNVNSSSPSVCSLNRISENKNVCSDTGNKSKSKAMKKLKSPSSATPLTACDSVSFSNSSAFDSLSHTLITSERSNHADLLQKSSAMCSTSDILAKAAESIFGHDAFSTIELSTDDQIQSEVDYNDQYDAAVAFTSSDIFSNSLIMPSVSRNQDFLRPKDQAPQNSVTNNNNNSSNVFTMENGNGQSSVSIYPNANSPFSAMIPEVPSEIKTNHEGFLEEPPSKRVKDNSCQTSHLVLGKRNSETVALNGHPKKIKSTDANKCATSSVASATWQGNHPIDSFCNIESLHSMPISQLNPCTRTSQSDSSLINRPQVSLPQHSIEFGLDANVRSSVAPSKNEVQSCRGLSGTSSSSSRTVISHSVNNLFNNTYRDSRNEASSSYLVTRSKNDPTDVLFQESLQNARKSCATGDCSVAKRPNASAEKAAAAAHSIFHFEPQNKSSSVPHSANSSVFPVSANCNAGTMPQITTSLVSSSVASNGAASQQALSMHLTAPLLSTDASAARSVQFFDSSFLSSASFVPHENKSYCVSSGNSDSLSHSLCSLLKESAVSTSGGSIPNVGSAILTPSSSAHSNAFATSTNNKYSALSLISNHFPETTESLAPQVNSSISAPQSSSSTSCFEELHAPSSICSRVQKTALSYSAERLIHSQSSSQEKGKTKANALSFSNGKKQSSNNSAISSQSSYKTTCFASTISSDLGTQPISTLPLPPVSSFPSFPATFPPPPPPMADVRLSSNVHGGDSIAEYHQSSQASQTHRKDNMLGQNSNFSVSSCVQNNIYVQQSADPLVKTHANLCLNVEAPNNLYSSCNFLQNTKSNLEAVRTSDNGSCFQSIFVNSSYGQQTPKQNFCHYIDQPPVGNSEISPEKAFPLIPPIRPFHTDKGVVGIPDQRAHAIRCTAQGIHGGNAYREPSNCSHDIITANKPSITCSSQETPYIAARPKQAGIGQVSSGGLGQHRAVSATTNKAKGKKSKHGAVLDTGIGKSPNFSSNVGGMNFSLFSVPDLSCGKSNVSHVPNSYAKHSSQPIISANADSVTQSEKMADSMVGPVMHHTFNTTLHQQNESLLGSLNFQAAIYSESPLAMPHPPPPPPSLAITSPCSAGAKSGRAFPITTHPIPNFNLSNILPDMNSANSSSSTSNSSIKFQPSSIPQDHSELHKNASILTVSHQSSCAPSLYPPHPPTVVPSAVPSMLAHGHTSINCSQPGIPMLSNAATLSQARSVTKNSNVPPPPPFRNIVHALSFP